ncbi:sensor histidine kinase [Allosphingosinicella indica]|uniref:histidine kinase n=1 Tax=Allosphingosinicella indica TaxID=941907 RepID=A0A1X7GT15_9SPHN|nr:histidine kinase [Allosphingosinicella indica]SMF74342.1 Histidine kinase [Allosphingosinicella indica]
MNLSQNLPVDLSIQRSRRRATWLLIAAFWVLTFSVLALRTLITDSLPFIMLAPRRLLAAAFGASLCLLMVWVFSGLRNRSFSERVAVGLVGAVLMSIAQTMFISLLYRVLMPLPDRGPLLWEASAQWVMVWTGYYLAWTGTHLALTYHWEAEDRHRQYAMMQELAQEAHIAALRYQVNPHFLFNTLNAISALVTEGRREEAEAMLLNLSAFLRSTLSGDPGGIIPLSDEIALQRLYLAIEEARFSERMRVELDVPEELAHVGVPALILQPLIENAVRYGVGRSEAMTTIRVSATGDEAGLRIAVEDDGAGGEGAGGIGIGLANVRDRLQAHFGERGNMEAGPREGGGYRTVIRLPLAGVA